MRSFFLGVLCVTGAAWMLAGMSTLQADEPKKAPQEATERYQKLLGLFHMPDVSHPGPDTVSYQVFLVPARISEEANPPQYPLITTATFKIQEMQWAVSGVVRLYMVRRGGIKQIGEAILNEDAAREVLHKIGESEVFSLPPRRSSAPYEGSGGWDEDRDTVFRFDRDGIRMTSRNVESAPMKALLEAFYPHVKQFAEQQDAKDLKEKGR